MEEFAGLVLIQTADGRAAIRLDGDSSKVTIGVIRNEVELDPLPVNAAATNDLVTIYTDRISIDGATGTITINGSDGSPLVTLDGADDNGKFVVRDGQGRVVLNFTSANAHLLLGAEGHAGDLIVRDAGGRDVLDFNSGAAQLSVGAANHAGNLIVRDHNGREAICLDGEKAQLFVGTKDAVGNEGDIYVYNNNGDEVIHLNGVNGDIILSNADAAEDFELAAGVEATPGAVMVLAGDGSVRPCAIAYDSKVIGVMAGAGAYRPAIVLDRRPGNNARRVPISVMGKVACRADAAYGTIEVGDLLTSSPTAGSAMRAADPLQAFGAVIGKALTPLHEGTGLVDMVIGLH